MYSSFQVLIIPGGLLATRPHADLGCSAVTDEVDGDLAQESQVASGRPIPDAAVILTEGDIQDPMEPIFDDPMPANCLDQDLGVIAAAGQKIADLRLGLMVSSNRGSLCKALLSGRTCAGSSNRGSLCKA